MPKKKIVNRLIWPASERREKEISVPDDEELKMFDHRRDGHSSFDVVAMAISHKKEKEKMEQDFNERITRAVREK